MEILASELPVHRTTRQLTKRWNYEGESEREWLGVTEGHCNFRSEDVRVVELCVENTIFSFNFGQL